MRRARAFAVRLDGELAAACDDLRRLGHGVCGSEDKDLRRALRHIVSLQPDVLVVWPGSDGAAWLEQLGQATGVPGVVVASHRNGAPDGNLARWTYCTPEGLGVCLRHVLGRSLSQTRLAGSEAGQRI